MQKKRTIKCNIGDKRFTVVEVQGDRYSGKSFEAAMRAAQPDRGNLVKVYAACAPDIASARMGYARTQLIRTFRFRRNG